MSALGCGCLGLEAADCSDDPAEADALRAENAPRAAAWRCPQRTGRAPPPSAEELPPLARRALRGVETLTGAAGLTTCPVWYTRLPWVGEACRARRWAERGKLPETAALEAAVDAVDHSVAARMADDAERSKKKP